MNGNKTGNGFDKHPENINKQGRPPKLVNAINKALEAEGFEAVSRAQIIDAFSILFNLPESRVKSMAKDKSSPILLRIVAKNMTGRYALQALEAMLDRAHDKPQKSVDVTTDGSPIQFSPAWLGKAQLDFGKLNDEELKLYEELTQKINS